MNEITFLHIIGARPQFIKYFPIQQAIENRGDVHKIRNIVIHTGQHYDYRMSKIFFDEIGIKAPDFHLEVGSGNHGRQTALVIERVEHVLLQNRPDVAIVYGDTNSTLGAALAAAKHHVPVAHVEAGLRSFNKCMPEEINRILTDHISTYLFCPSETAVRNLNREGFQTDDRKNIDIPNVDHPMVMRIGDVMYDMLRYALPYAQKSRVLESLNLEAKNYYLLTLHRAENTDSHDVLNEIIRFINKATKGKTVIFPMHPRMIKVYQHSKERFADNIRVIDPLGYFDLLMLLRHANRVFTDSGGMQKEAYWLRVPCITIRDETEWMETIDSGWNVLYRNYHTTQRPQGNINAYGDGFAADRIVDTLLKRGMMNTD
jgi:UDP-GlcNAc3NAcA epimerase